MTIPDPSLVLLIGASGSGKSTFALAHFRPTEVISSDTCRALVSDDEGLMDATGDAFDVLRYIACKRLARGKLTVVDATSVKPEHRSALMELARQYHALSVAIVLNVPSRVCLERNRLRPERSFGPHVVRGHTRELQRSLPGLKLEGFEQVFVLSSPEEIAEVKIERLPLVNSCRSEHGPD
jgi:protein phosphatase